MPLRATRHGGEVELCETISGSTATTPAAIFKPPLSAHFTRFSVKYTKYSPSKPAKWTKTFGTNLTTRVIAVESIVFNEKKGESIMSKEKKVEQITDMDVDFTQWFTDVVIRAELIGY